MQDVIEDRMEIILLQSKGFINKDWVLLDSQSTTNFSFNALLLTNIREVGYYLNIFCNARSMRTNMVGDLNGYDTVWFYANGIADILLLYRVSERFYVTYNSQENNCFIM